MCVTLSHCFNWDNKLLERMVADSKESPIKCREPAMGSTRNI